MSTLEKEILNLLKLYDKKQDAGIQKILKYIYAIFETNALAAAKKLAVMKLLKDGRLSPEIKRTIERIANTVASDTEKQIINGINYAWKVSDIKNSRVEDLFLGKGKGVVYTHQAVIKSFIRRKQNGLGLSDRVYKLSKYWQKTIESNTQKALATGMSARDIGKKYIRALKNPNGIDNPGQGVYGSARKNAERTARTEINLAYASADFRRWQTQWFVIGIEVRLSAAHPKYDICDPLAGKYPKTFYFPKWHPQCLCIGIPILADKKTRDDMLKYQLGIISEKPKVDYIKELPAAAIDYFQKNRSRILGWKSRPYWLQYNKSALADIFKLDAA